jgi:phosphoribosylformimino-5-aminoimidazole carboxamide ribotide isomerase
MTIFRPCIDLHDGAVKQIVGGSLRDGEAPTTNFTSALGADHYASMYRVDGLHGGHVIQLGPGNSVAAHAALSAFPKGLQLGGGVTVENARRWLDAGASKVIVTSHLFEGGKLSRPRLEALSAVVLPSELVIDLSCRREGSGYRVVIDRWQTMTDVEIDERTLEGLATHCSEFLVHAAHAEGLRAGIDEELVRRLGAISPLPCTYAGGANHIDDLDRVERSSGGRVDLTYGSALDIFGGAEVRYRDCVAYNQRRIQFSR